MSQHETTRSYRELIAWQKAMDLVPLVYALVKRLPKEENYALGDQMRRAVISVAANIAEGQGRQHPKEFLQFLSMARGSLAELDTLLLAAQRLNYLTSEQMVTTDALLLEVRRVLQGLMQSIQRRVR